MMEISKELSFKHTELINFDLYSKSKSKSSCKDLLILDDEIDVVTIMTEGLQRYGFKTYGFSDPLLALDSFKANPAYYDLVISDLRMPKMNGFEFIKIVKKIKPEVKVFLMTAFEISHTEFLRLLPDVKIDKLIEKPISIKELSTIINKIK
jgi:DNA-binding NtrC family response regulator